MTKKSLRAFAATAIAALALSLGGGVAALADEDPAVQLGAGSIDVGYKDASIIIHKKLNPQSTHKATGEKDDSAEGQDLAGIKFVIQKLNYKLDDNDGLKTVAALKAENVTEKNYEAGTSKEPTRWEVTTEENGEAAQNVPVGVYLVTEIVPKDSVTAGGKPIDASTILPSKPFLVRVPMPSSDGKSWNYNVHVYPKNSTDLVEKKVIDARKNAGDKITYTINVAAPLVATGDQRTKFVVEDHYDKTKLENVWVTGVKVNDKEIDEGTHYDVLEYPDPGTILVEFKKQDEHDEKSALIYEIPNNATVTVNLSAKMKDDAVGEIVNNASRIDRDSSMKADRTRSAEPVVTYLGKVKVLKQDQGGKSLSGAKFDIYRCDPDGDGTYTLNGNAIQTLETGSDGTAVSKGLHVTDYENDSQTVRPENQNYCLQETQAPAGYILPEGDAAITPFTITRADLVLAGGKATETVKVLPAIENTPSNTPDLPLTGGKGVGLLVVLGAAVAGAAVYSARRNSVRA
ncbi:MAG: SpaH/EbpB family LPXTG-anchored major pilin [Actinomycetaceae bacterium]|nr:SpaH/EbpB family LPXTG-anchored major pilin [Actinomycetaceae bacterium]